MQLREIYQIGDGIHACVFFFFCILNGLSGSIAKQDDAGNARPSSLNHYKTLNMDLCHLIRKRRDSCRDAN